MRTRLEFSLLKSVVVSLRGHKGKMNHAQTTPMPCLSFNFIPEGVENSYGDSSCCKIRELTK